MSREVQERSRRRVKQSPELTSHLLRHLDLLAIELCDRPAHGGIEIGHFVAPETE